ncbi:SpoIID/LytB domain-containing protein [bacterium]|nr:SpoIID/LytB domain-containing protein [bacterium]
MGRRRALFSRLRKVRRRLGGLLPVCALSLALGLFACVTEEPRRPDPPLPDTLPGEPTMRVLLVEGAKEVKVGADGPIDVVPSAGEAFVADKLQDGPASAGDGTGLVLGERTFFGALECRLVPTRSALGKVSHVRLDGKPYSGEVILRVDHGVVRVLNHVSLETYVAGVVGGEMPLKWPDAAVRAQAIAARTYAVWQWKHRSSEDHDLLADTRSQVYTGVATARALEVTRATEGRVLVHAGRIFEAFFCSTCAGETASAEWVWGGPMIPPLQGTTCGKCLASSHARWTKEITPADLAKALAPLGIKAPVTRIETLPWPRGGYLRELKVTHAGGETLVDAQKARKALDLKSTSFEVAASPQGSLLVTGRGWGHGAGLCQWGAKGCAEDGLSEDEILKKYYPGAEVVKLY